MTKYFTIPEVFFGVSQRFISARHFEFREDLGTRLGWPGLKLVAVIMNMPARYRTSRNLPARGDVLGTLKLSKSSRASRSKVKQIYLYTVRFKVSSLKSCVHQTNFWFFLKVRESILFVLFLTYCG